MYCHDLEVLSSNLGWVKLVHSTSVQVMLEPKRNLSVEPCFQIEQVCARSVALFTIINNDLPFKPSLVQGDSNNSGNAIW